MLLRNSGIRDIEAVLEVSRPCVLNNLEKHGSQIAVNPENDEIVAYVTGDRSSKTVKKLYKKLEHLEIDEFCTDDWLAFQKVLPAHKHKVGKKYTKNIEGVNTCFRAGNTRLVRQTTCFSKKKDIIYML